MSEEQTPSGPPPGPSSDSTEDLDKRLLVPRQAPSSPRSCYRRDRPYRAHRRVDGSVLADSPEISITD